MADIDSLIGKQKQPATNNKITKPISFENNNKPAANSLASTLPASNNCTPSANRVTQRNNLFDDIEDNGFLGKKNVVNLDMLHFWYHNT